MRPTQAVFTYLFIVALGANQYLTYQLLRRFWTAEFDINYA